MNENKIRILIIEDDQEMQRLYKFYLTELTNLQLAFESVSERIATSIETFKPDLIILDLSLGGQQVQSVIERYSQRSKIPQIIVLTANDSVAVAVQAMRAGAFNYLVKPVNRDEFLAAIQHAIDYVDSLKELTRLKEEISAETDFPGIIANAPAMQKMLNLITNLAKTDFSVLLQGESGTGKDLVARLLHQKSPRAKQTFVAVNCAALPDTLVESELFGYEKGAFTGAMQRHQGKFEQANGGTIFLDEIGDMGINAQSRLLRVLQEGEIYRLGGNEPIRVSVRVIAATNRDLQQAIQEGTFRQDLYYRLSVFPVNIPPLRERREDIIPLILHFWEAYRSEEQHHLREFSSAAIDALENYSWPGNVRELQNVVRRMLLTVDENLIEKEYLPAEIVAGGRLETKENQALMQNEPTTLAEIEKTAIIQTLAFTRNQIAPAARHLGIGRSTLYRKMELYGIHLPETDA